MVEDLVQHPSFYNEQFNYLKYVMQEMSYNIYSHKSTSSEERYKVDDISNPGQDHRNIPKQMDENCEFFEGLLHHLT